MKGNFFYFLMGWEAPQDVYLSLSISLSQLGVYMEYAEGESIKYNINNINMILLLSCLN